MAFASEIRAKLGIDTSSVGTDLAGAKNVFNRWGKDIASSGGRTGAQFGTSLVGGIGKKLAGTQALSGALGAALGLNVTTISNKIAALIVGGSEEGWREFGKIADENAKLISRKFELMNPKSAKQQGENLKKELTKAIDAANSIKGSGAETDLKRETALKRITELEVAILELNQEQAKGVAEHVAFRKKAKLDELSDAKKVEALNQEIADITLEMLKGTMTQGELGKAEIKILEAHKELKEAMKRITEEDTKLGKQDIEDKAKAQKEEISRQEKITALKEKQSSQSKKISDAENTLGDRSKLTVGELASMTSGKNGFSLGKSALDLSFSSNSSDDGLNEQQLAAKRKAQEIQRLEAEAESKRLMGDVAGSESALGQVGQLRDELVGSGATKSTEGDGMKDLKKQIASDGKELRALIVELNKIESGKYVSQ